MIQRCLPILLGLLSFCLPAFAEPLELTAGSPLNAQAAGVFYNGPGLALYPDDIFSSVELSAVMHGLPGSSMLDARRFPATTALGRMGTIPYDLFPVAALTAVEVPRSSRTRLDLDDETDTGAAMLSKRIHASGEIGFSYGRSTGKYGGDFMDSYIIGTVGTDKVQVTAGASYSESNLRIPARTR